MVKKIVAAENAGDFCGYRDVGDGLDFYFGPSALRLVRLGT